MKKNRFAPSTPAAASAGRRYTGAGPRWDQYVPLDALNAGNPAPSGMLTPGNINLFAQPEVKNPDGSTSTVHSFSIGVNGKEVLLPTVMPDGRHLSQEDAIREYYRTGRHMGEFATPDEATAYAEQVHNDYAGGAYKGGPSTPARPPVPRSPFGPWRPK